MSARMRMITVLAMLALGAGGLSGCGGNKAQQADEIDKPAETIFAEAQQLLREGNEGAAAKRYDDVERLYPYSPLAKDAMLMSSKAYFDDAQYDEAIVAANRYIDYYPSDEGAAYARYLIAESYYERITDVGRDQAVTENAMAAMRDVARLHPDSKYANDARLKLELTEDHLAGKEMQVGRYYLKSGNYGAAINRFRNVVEKYQTTSHIEEALHRLVESYLALGVVDEAQDAAAVLGHNFPGSPWYEDSYVMLQNNGLRPDANEGSWMNRAFRQIVKGEWL